MALDTSNLTTIYLEGFGSKPLLVSQYRMVWNEKRSRFEEQQTAHGKAEGLLQHLEDARALAYTCGHGKEWDRIGTGVNETP